MAYINLLDKDTFSKIAAGEVVERPASVVKELLENSLDARSSKITVEIENGGIDLIKIVDDGQGIRNDDLRNAFMPHATSKIKNIEDIFTIRTLGFRGEALASIASVGKVLLKSKHGEDKDGMEIYIEGGEEKYLKYSPVNKGTHIEVRELFFNVPARLKFLKTIQREGQIIGDIILRLALSRPDVSFTYINSGKTVVNTYGSGDIRDVIRSVYNRKTLENSNYFYEDFDDFKVYGYLGNEELSRASRNQQSLFINGRYVKSLSITAAVEQAFKSFITVSKHPFFVLFIDINPEAIDVNVHPQKAEVKFSDERLIFKAVFDTIHKSLREIYKNDLGFSDSFTSSPFTEMGGSQESFIGMKDDIKQNKSSREDFLPMDITDKRGLDFYKDEREKEESFNKNNWHNLNKISEVEIPIDLKGNLRQEGEKSYGKSLTENIDEKSGGQEKARISSLDQIDNKPILKEVNYKFPKLRVIGQFNKTYILAELEDTLYLIDQHAAHEKINFERYLKEISQGDIIIQPLLSPHPLELALDDYDLAISNIPLFSEMGFTLEDFGNKTVFIREVPYFLGRVEVEKYFQEVLDNLKNLGKGTTKEVKYLKIATVACKASVKANDELRHEEMVILLEDLRKLDEPFTCPHGRPTIIKMTKYELEKLFRRVQ